GIRSHLRRQEGWRDDMRAVIDAWWPMLEADGIEAIVVTASGCGVTVKEYGHLLAQDPEYREKAARISALARDLCEVIPVDAIPQGAGVASVAFHSPCTLRHGQQLRGRVETLLVRAGYELTSVRDAHLCCGSAGTYSLLQPAMAVELRARKLAALHEVLPLRIARVTRCAGSGPRPRRSSRQPPGTRRSMKLRRG